MVGSGFCLFFPEVRHILAKLIATEENRIHNNNEEKARMFMRRTGYSSKEMAHCLEYFQPPSTFRRVAHNILDQHMNRILKSNKSCMPSYQSRTVPAIKITPYMWDFSKDNALMAYLFYHRWNYIQDSTIHGLIVTFGLSLLASAIKNSSGFYCLC